jgi:hypothetical protein
MLYSGKSANSQIALEENYIYIYVAVKYYKNSQQCEKIYYLNSKSFKVRMISGSEIKHYSRSRVPEDYITSRNSSSSMTGFEVYVESTFPTDYPCKNPQTNRMDKWINS